LAAIRRASSLVSSLAAALPLQLLLTNCANEARFRIEDVIGPLWLNGF
jgi:hypothetical protein